MFGMDAEDCVHEDEDDDDERRGREGEPKSFSLLNDLSDLLMLPKDMLMDRHVREEVNSLNPILLLSPKLKTLFLSFDLIDCSNVYVVQVCPSISLPLIIRILCNFTPDEFCPDPVPGAVLEALNAEV